MVDKQILVTQAEFARISGVSRQGITKAVRAGLVDKCKLTLKIDVTLPKNASYIRECMSRRNKLEGTSIPRRVKHVFSEADDNSEVPVYRDSPEPDPSEPHETPKPAEILQETPPKPEIAKKPSIHEVLPYAEPVPVDLSSSDFDGLDISNMLKADVDKLKTIEAIDQVRLKNDQMRRKLIERDMVQVVLGRIHTVDVQQFLAIPIKFAPKAAGLCGVSDQEIIHKIEKDLERELYKALNHVKRIVDEFLDEIEESLESTGDSN